MKSSSPCCISAVAVAALVAGCARSAPPPIQHDGAAQFHVVASIEELMDAEVDPAADALWDSVAIVATSSGTQYRQPHTAAEWDSVRHNALTLSEATNLLLIAHRPVAAAAGARARAPGELSAAEIQRHIEADRATFAQFARSLQLAAVSALQAIDARDANALMNAGAVIDGACEACHVVYWYPNLKGPRSP
jgi:hypothetical protein